MSNQKNLGHVTAYAYAKSKGYTGTEEEFAELMANFAEAAEEANESSLKSEGFAVGEQGGIPVESGSPYYHNNAEYYAGQTSIDAGTASGKAVEASQSASDASGYKDIAASKASEAAVSATNAGANALTSEGYAVGKQNNVDVSSGSPYYQNNSRYFKELAEAAKDAILRLSADASVDANVGTPSVTVTVTNESGGKRMSFAFHGLKGADGENGESGVYYGTTAPTDPDVNVWIDPSGTNVSIPAPANPSDGQFLVYSASQSAWIGQTVPSANGVSF